VLKYIVFSLGVCLSSAVYAVPAVVDYVLDGDTFAAGVKIEDDITITVRVRVINIDTPEINGACQSEIDMANRAKDFVTAMLTKGTVVDLRNVKDDKYLGRIDANVILSDGRDLGGVLIKEKLARPYSGGKRYSWCD
jgi:endonuclease YncB( thermonuclease family)